MRTVYLTVKTHRNLETQGNIYKHHMLSSNMDIEELLVLHVDSNMNSLMLP